ncbi:metallophosphoesterase [Emcibacter sp. SYSU 3D8]|uniref:metallophosphoesterase n=1 Tax=Emcibacter sp. SYSU 3D8 TaxID=3133969 RepID=UPI0031FE7722
MRLPSLFLIVMALVGALHGYIGIRLLPDLPVSGTWRLAGAGMLTASFLLMPMSVASRGVRQQPLSDILAWAGSLFMGLFSSLLILTLIRDLVLLGMALSASDPAFTRFAVRSAVAVPVLAVLATLIGLINARRRAQIKHVEVPIDGLPDALHGFVIAQITDIHVGPTIKRRYLDAIVDAVNGIGADLIAVTGDVVDGNVRDLAHHTQPLSRLTARHGAFFVTGNHEYYSGAPAWTAEMRRLGLIVLVNGHNVLDHDGALLVIAGVPDYSAHHFDPAERSDPAAAIRGAPEGLPRILLAHQPRSAAAAAEAGFHLQLSGHTHGGQFWPWNHFVRLQQPFIGGLDRLGDLWVYTSRGTGYWGPPKRLGVPSEITRIRLIPAG